MKKLAGFFVCIWVGHTRGATLYRYRQFHREIAQRPDLLGPSSFIEIGHECARCGTEFQ